VMGMMSLRMKLMIPATSRGPRCTD
jgi:hypothetical protein